MDRWRLCEFGGDWVKDNVNGDMIEYEDHLEFVAGLQSRLATLEGSELFPLTLKLNFLTAQNEVFKRENLAFEELLGERNDRIAALEQLAEMVLDPSKVGVDINNDPFVWAHALQERARELMEVKG